MAPIPPTKDTKQVVSSSPSPLTNNDNNNRNPLEYKLTLTTDCEYDSYLRCQSMTTYVNCHLQAPEFADDDRKPIDLVIVLDRSGSMSGEKLRLCKKTLEVLLRELKNGDRFSLVTFDNTVKTDVPLTKLTSASREHIKSTINKIHTGGSTNLSGGILSGMQEIQAKTRSDGSPPNEVKSVLILTDGHANHGLKSTQEIAKMLEASLLPNVSLFTFGYGTDHNSAMLKEISDIGRGMYYFVKDVDGVAMAFADCLGGLLSVVAQSIKVECTSINGVKIKSVETKKPVRTIEKESKFEVEMGDLYAEEVRDIILEVEMPAIPNEEELFGLVEFHVRYANILNSSLEECSNRVVVRRLEQVKKDRVANSRVVKQKNRIAATKAMEKAKLMADRGDFDNGRNVLQDVITEMEQMELVGGDNADSSDEDCCAELLEDLKMCRKNMASSSAYSLGGQQNMVQTAQMYGMQRSNFADVKAFGVKGNPNDNPIKRGAFAGKKKKGVMSSMFSAMKS